MYSRKISILIVDDHEVVRQGLKAYLEAQPDFKVVAEASSGEEAIEALKQPIEGLDVLYNKYRYIRLNRQ